MKLSFQTDNSVSAETRIRIIEAGEVMFADLGVDKAPLRSIALASGQRNINAVQYHFGDRWGLLTAIFEYRESQLDMLRANLLEAGRADNFTDEVRRLMRVIFEPNFRHYKFKDGLNYLIIHASYLINHRPRGMAHPVDYPSSSTISLREAIRLLREHLSRLETRLFHMRLEAVGAMFLNSVIQHQSTPRELRPDDWTLFHHLIEMAAAAITVEPWTFDETANLDTGPAR